MMGCVLQPILNCYSFAMERNLALASVKAWMLRRKAFGLVERLVVFSVLT